MAKILIVEDEPVMVECLKTIISQLKQHQVASCADVLEAIQKIDADLPDLLILDVLLTGPNAFTLLNELVTYQDTAQIPVILVTSLEMAREDLAHYGVKKVFDKATMMPTELQNEIEEILDAA